MKKKFLLLLILIITIACNTTIDEENNIEKEELLKTLYRTTDPNNSDTLQELIDLDLHSKFKIITYVSGAVMLRNVAARNEVEVALENDDTVLVSDLLFSHDFQNFKCEYKFIFYSLIGMDKPLDPSGELEFGDIFGGKCLKTGGPDTFDVFIEDFHNNCFELYFPAPFNTSVNQDERLTDNEQDTIIYGIPHPLIEFPFSQEILIEGQRISKQDNSPIVEMSYINIEENFVETHTQNVFVTRLRSSSRDCDYGNFSLTFFASFLNIN